MIIASRALKLQTDDGVAHIPIRIFVPQPAPSGSWSCCYEIGWPDGQHSMEACGADSVQALALALQMIGSEIYTSSYHKSGALFLEAPGRGYGFPVPASLRDLLEGDDATFF
jgi:hypothetical protein